MPTLQEMKDAKVRDARAIAEGAKAAGRSMTTAELEKANGLLDEIRGISAQIEDAKESEDLLDRLGKLDGGHHPTVKSGGPEYLDLSPAGMKAFTTAISQNLVGQEGGRKGILPSGESWGSLQTTPTDPVSMGKAAQGLLSVLPVIKISDAPGARYLRQSTRVLAASYVPAGQAKPVTQLGITPQDVVLKVYATLSEPQDRFQLEDAQAAAAWIAGELTYSVLTAVEADVVNGTAPGIVGVLSTSGIKTEAFDTSLLQSTRNAVTTAEKFGYANDLVWALAPSVWSEAEMSTAQTSGTFTFPGPPVDRAARRLWGIPVATVNDVPDDTAVLIDRPGVAIYTDQKGIRVDLGSPRDLWEKNEVEFRCEGRWDLAVLMPESVIKVSTAAVGP